MDSTFERFSGRKGDNEPGVTVVWRGWQRLTDIAEDWLLFRKTNLWVKVRPLAGNSRTRP